MTPDEYCQQKAAASGSSFYYSFLFLPPERRRAITALYAFCREVDDVVDECTDRRSPQAKLAWWRGEIAALFDAAAAAPGDAALRRHRRPFGITRERLNEILDGMEMDLRQNRYLDFAALERYCYHVAGVVGLLAAGIFGYSRPADARVRGAARHWRSSSPTSSATSARTRARAASTCRSTSCALRRARRGPAERAATSTASCR